VNSVFPNVHTTHGPSGCHVSTYLMTHTRHRKVWKVKKGAFYDTKTSSDAFSVFEWSSSWEIFNIWKDHSAALLCPREAKAPREPKDAAAAEGGNALGWERKEVGEEGGVGGGVGGGGGGCGSGHVVTWGLCAETRGVQQLRVAAEPVEVQMAAAAEAASTTADSDSDSDSNRRVDPPSDLSWRGKVCRRFLALATGDDHTLAIAEHFRAPI
jgi:hypothetical protein